VPAIQVGFPGRNADFHRQLGPDGEEQDIIGPDGHTEQLPPYSKYPNENEKALTALANGVPASPAPSHESEELPAPSAQPPSQTSQDRAERPPSETINSDTTAPASEKSWKEKNWKERWKTKVLYGHLPCWLLVIALGCLMFVGIVIGGAIGGFLAKEKQDKYDIHRHHSLTTLTLQTELLLSQTQRRLWMHHQFQHPPTFRRFPWGNSCFLSDHRMRRRRTASPTQARPKPGLATFHLQL
jgi:hypothetical protein